MPFGHGDIGVQKQLLQAFELVVDQRLQRRNVENAHGRRGLIIQLRQHRQEGGLRLARGRAGGEQQVIVAVEDHLAGCHLTAPQLLPFILVDEILYERRKPFKCVHSFPPKNLHHPGSLMVLCPHVIVHPFASLKPLKSRPWYCRNFENSV